MSISLGLAENYAMLGSQYIYLEDVIDVKGFMGSDFLSYAPNSNLDSNGIELTGSIPNAPIVNGAAAKQAIADVTTAIGIMTGFITIPLPANYNGIPINRPIIAAGDQVLNTILTGTTAPTDGSINVYNITGGNLTMSGDVDFTVNASTVCIFIVEGYISISFDITRTGGILPQNIIFIAGLQLDIYNNVTVSGIYISTGDFVYINNATLTGRLISTDTTISGYHGSSGNTNSTVTAP